MRGSSDGQQQLACYGELTSSQQNPTLLDDDLIPNAASSTLSDYKSECPPELHSKLKSLIELDLTHEVIKQAIQSWIPESSPGSKTNQL